ncbi:MAG: PAS domain S-box protein [Steroidobacteraceae bacterium]
MDVGCNQPEEQRSSLDAAASSSLRLALTQLLGAQADTTAIERLIGALGLTIALLDEGGTMRWTSSAFDELIGESLPVGTQWSRYTLASIDHEGALRRAREGHVAEAVCRLRNDKTLRVRFSPIRGSRGEIVALALSAQSLVRQQALEAELRHVHLLLQQVGNAALEHVVVLDRELRVLYSSRKVNDTPAEQLVGRSVNDIAPSAVLEEVLAALQSVVENQQPGRLTVQVPSAEGEHRHYELRVVPVRREGELFALTVIVSEITEQLRAERAIATQARMIESMLEGVAMVNDAHMIEISNPAFDAMFGYRRGELIGREFASLSTRALTELQIWGAAAAGNHPGSLHLEFEAQRRDGSVFAVAGILSRFEIAGRNQNLVVVQDVSERKRLERAILQAVNREQYRIGNDLHDGLGQELTGIALMLRSVAARLQGEYPALLPDIEGITKLVSNAVESTRALARGLSPVNLERGGLQDALEGLAMHARELYGAKVMFAHRIQGAKPLTAELANHLYRIAQEAVRNAVRHGNARLIRLHLGVARGKVRLTVTDDGSGLPAQALEAPGMGLKIMRYRAQMVGGEVRFEAAEPCGTRIVCECPLEMASHPTTGVTTPARRKRAVKRGEASGA